MEKSIQVSEMMQFRLQNGVSPKKQYSLDTSVSFLYICSVNTGSLLSFSFPNSTCSSINLKSGDMKNLPIPLFVLFLIHVTASAQECFPCLPDGITFTTQSQIDSSQINYPGCTEIEGDVKILGDNIVNLDSLYVLTSIGRSLEIGEDGGLAVLNPS